MEIAQVAARTMNNYILMDKILKCSIVEDTSKYSQLFKKWKKKFVFADKYKNYLLEKNKPKNSQEMKEYITSLLNKEEEKRKKLKEMGIVYDFPGFV
jgi:nucleolar protein 15